MRRGHREKIDGPCRARPKPRVRDGEAQIILQRLILGDGSKWRRRAADIARQRSSRRFSSTCRVGQGWIVLQRLVAIFDGGGSGVETVFPETANERRYAAMGDECARRAGRLYRLQQTRPVRMVGKRQNLGRRRAAGDCRAPASSRSQTRRNGRRTAGAKGCPPPMAARARARARAVFCSARRSP